MLKSTDIIYIKRTTANFLLLVAIATIFTVSITKPKELYANWITSCSYSHSNNDDPIVFPGLPGSSHLHDFIGARTTNAFSTANSLLSGATNCLTQGDHSSYWTPALYKNGNVRVLPGGTSKHLLAYYSGSAGTRPHPLGLRMVIGNARATSPAENPGIVQGHIDFKCAPGSTTHYPAPPASCASGLFAPVFTFPNCWDGRNLDSADHISHMAYGGNNCPASHPVKLPQLKVFIRYGVGTGNMLPINFASGPYYTAHMDFFNAWVPSALSELVDKCINNGDCEQNPPVSGGGTPIPTMTPIPTATRAPTQSATRTPTVTRTPPTPTNGGSIPGDANGDGSVSILDFQILSNNFGATTSGGPSAGDFNRDGIVDILDFQILTNNWTR